MYGWLPGSKNPEKSPSRTCFFRIALGLRAIQKSSQRTISFLLADHTRFGSDCGTYFRWLLYQKQSPMELYVLAVLRVR